MNWSSLVSPFKYLIGAVVTICLISGLVWFCINHWVFCLVMILGYVFFEILRPAKEQEL